jgi:hypothetical protein
MAAGMSATDSVVRELEALSVEQAVAVPSPTETAQSSGGGNGSANGRRGELPASLVQVLQDVVTFGTPAYQWNLMQKLLVVALAQCLDAARERDPAVATNQPMDEDYKRQRHRLLTALASFDGAPFTLQVRPILRACVHARELVACCARGVAECCACVCHCAVREL